MYFWSNKVCLSIETQLRLFNKLCSFLFLSLTSIITLFPACYASLFISDSRHVRLSELATHVGRVRQYITKDGGTLYTIKNKMTHGQTKRQQSQERKWLGATTDVGTIGFTGHKLQRCICGWVKVTSEKGLGIYQGKIKCLREVSEVALHWPIL